MNKNKKLNILFVGSEAVPFVKVGGLGEVLYSLPKTLRELGHDVRVMIPSYSSIDKDKFNMTYVAQEILVPNPGKDDLICNVKEHKDKNGWISYFLENQEYYEKRGSVYGYDDDAARWALLSRGTLEFVKEYRNTWKPDIIVANDWQGGLLPNYVKREYKDDPIISKIPVVFVIHNIHYQGMFDHKHISELDYDDGQSDIPAITDARLLKTNFMRRGIRYADAINTVSENYAREITTPEYGEGLNNILQERRSCLSGILNGINYDQYDPESNPHIEYKYDSKNLSERAKNKRILQKKFNLPERDDVFIAAVVSRLSSQKGLDLIIESLEHLMENYDFQFIVIGSGSSKYHAFFEKIEKENKNVATHLSFDNILPHIIFAGADTILIPSLFEPSGLTQMEAMRYGAIPLVRKIGGLADSVEDYNAEKQTGTGFSFEKYDPYAFFGAFVRAYETHKYPKAWEGLQKRAMAANFSWQKSAKEYVKLFERVLSNSKIEK